MREKDMETLKEGDIITSKIRPQYQIVTITDQQIQIRPNGEWGLEWVLPGFIEKNFVMDSKP